MNKKILFLVLFSAFLFPVIASAQTIGGMLESILLNVVWPVAVACVVIFWVATGILFLAAMGSPDKLKLAKMALIASAIGTLVIIVSASAIAIVRNSLGL